MARLISKFLIFLAFSAFMGGVFVWLIYPTGARAERMIEKNEAEIDTLLLEGTNVETFSAEALFEFDVFVAKVQVALDGGDYKEAKDLLKEAKKKLKAVENLFEYEDDGDHEDDHKQKHKKENKKHKKKHKKHHDDDYNEDDDEDGNHRRGWNGTIGHVDHGKSHKKGGDNNEGDGDAISSISQDQLLASAVVSSGYYIRPLPAGVGRKSQGRHGRNAVDFAAPKGTPIMAAAAGVVLYSGWGDGYGRYILIGHDNGTKTLYAHNSKNIVRKGDNVEQGEVIGHVGSTGDSTGPHVHFEIHGAKNPF